MPMKLEVTVTLDQNLEPTTCKITAGRGEGDHEFTPDLWADDMRQAADITARTVLGTAGWESLYVREAGTARYYRHPTAEDEWKLVE